MPSPVETRPSRVLVAGLLAAFCLSLAACGDASTDGSASGGGTTSTDAAPAETTPSDDYPATLSGPFMRSASRRTSPSVTPPAGYGTTMVTGRFG